MDSNMQFSLLTFSVIDWNKALRGKIMKLFDFDINNSVSSK